MKLCSAIRFFTRLPVGKAKPCMHHESLQNLVPYLPFVGLILGTILALALALASLITPPLLCGVLGCAVLTLCTGGLHLDGVADCADALIAETTPSHRLEIMKDPQLGTFGALALFMVLSGKVAAFAALAEHAQTTDNRFFVLILAACIVPVLSRCTVFVAFSYPLARPNGLGSLLCQGVTVRQKRFALGCGMILALSYGIHGLLVFMGMVLVAVAVTRFAVSRLGGITGDVFGGVIEVTETIGFMAWCINL